MLHFIDIGNLIKQESLKKCQIIILSSAGGFYCVKSSPAS